MSQIFIKTSDGRYLDCEYSSGGDYVVTGIAANPRDAMGETTQQPTRPIAKKDYAGADTNITIDEVYNQIKLTCNLEELEEIVTSPTNSDELYSPFTNRQKYCSEFIAWGEGSSAFTGFWELLADGTDYDGAEIYHHYVQVQKSHAWRFNGDQYISDDGTNQQNVLRQARAHTCTAFLCSMGHGEGKKSMKDNSVESKISMDDFLVISINGNGKDDSSAVPTENQINAASPVAEYIGNMGGGYLSPTDSETTNYIVISGKIYMQSEKQKCSQNRLTPQVRTDYPRLKQYAAGTRQWMTDLISFWHQTVHLDDNKNGDGGYYFCKFYDCATPQSAPVEVTTADSEGIFPYNDQWKSCTDLKYAWSSIGSEEDKIYKYPMLAVELKIGEKYCVETFNQDGTSSYAWRTLEQCPVRTYNGVSTKQTWLFIGPNPAIDDDLIGKMWDMANSVTPEMGIDAEGIAIPVRKSDELSGKVSLKILGPVNSTWNEIERIHPTWLRHTEWNEYTRSVLGRTAAIFIKDFEVNVYSDNAAINNIQGDKDLIYMTDVTGIESVNALDDIEFDVCTALTTEECTQKGIKNSVKMNNPYIDKEPLRSVYNRFTGNTAKPEEHYVSDYYDEYCRPHMLISSTIRTSASNIWTYHWTMDSLPNKVFLTQGYTYDAKKDAYTMNFKEE